MESLSVKGVITASGNNRLALKAKAARVVHLAAFVFFREYLLDTTESSLRAKRAVDLANGNKNKPSFLRRGLFSYTSTFLMLSNWSCPRKRWRGNIHSPV